MMGADAKFLQLTRLGGSWPWQDDQGSMLRSQFSAIFGEKIYVFLKNQCYDQNFA
jgi:hypothetical protein